MLLSLAIPEYVLFCRLGFWYLWQCCMKLSYYFLSLMSFLDLWLVASRNNSANRFKHPQEKIK